MNVYICFVFRKKTISTGGHDFEGKKRLRFAPTNRLAVAALVN
jgi:hypothetical protein